LSIFILKISQFFPNLENIISAGRVINMDKLANKIVYNIIKNKVFIKPIGIHFWTTYLDIQDFQNITDLYEFILFISPNILVSYLSKISWCFCLSTSKFYPTVYYFFIVFTDLSGMGNRIKSKD
jgi:hypothetical protein